MSVMMSDSLHKWPVKTVSNRSSCPTVRGLAYFVNDVQAKCLAAIPRGKYLFKVYNRDTKTAPINIVMLSLLLALSKELPSFKYYFYPFALTFFHAVLQYIKKCVRHSIQIKWLVSTWSTTLDLNGLTTVVSIGQEHCSSLKS